MAARALVISNWKMNPPSWREAKRLLEATKKAADRAPNVNVVVCPPAIYLRDLRQVYKGKRLAYGVQHANPNGGGAHTGEISLAQAKDSGATHVLVGHAERRARGESDEEVRQKVAGALALKMTPILCVGEHARDAGGEHFGYVKNQLRAGFADVSPARVARVVVSYEPVWAIGAAASIHPRDMHEMGIFIRKSIVDMYPIRGAGADAKGFEAAMKVKILYGGSVSNTNAGEMLIAGDVQGLVVGRASEDPASINALLEAIEATL